MGCLQLPSGGRGQGGEGRPVDDPVRGMRFEEALMIPAGSTVLLREALTMMLQALDILDREKAPGDIGAHLDLAIQRLRETLAS